MPDYITLIPRKFVLDSGEIVTLTAYDVEEKLTKETLFRLWIPRLYVEDLYKHFIKEGFEKATPAWPKGEKYSLRKVLSDIWELHVRIYETGFIDAEVEVRREFIEHLTTSRRINVIYEIFKFYRDVYDKLHVLYVPKRKWIVKVIDHFHVRLREPDSLTPWTPLVVLGIVAIGIGAAMALSKLTKGEGEK